MSVGTLLRRTKHIWGTLIGVTIATMLFAMQGLLPALVIGVIAAGFAALLGAPSPPAIKAGLLAGLIGVVFMLTYGVNKPAIALLSGVTSGLGAGLIVSQRFPTTNLARGAINGLIAGLIAGGITVVMLLAVWLKIAGAAGHEPLEFLAILQKTVPGAASITNDVTIILYLSAYTLIAAALFGTATGAVRALEGTPGRIGLLAVLGTVVLLMPLINSMTKLQILSELIPVYVFVLLALGLNIVVGYAGLLDLGYAAFFGIGAYTVGILSSRQFAPQIGFSMNFWLVIWVAAAVAAIAGVILGAPTLPLRGDYLAIVTLGFGEILPIMLRNLGGGGSTGTVMFEFFGIKLFDEPRNLTGGNSGITAINPPKLCEEGCPQFSSQFLGNWYFLIVALVVVTIFFINRLRESRQGRAWTAIREDELAADAMGINTVKTKLLAFAMGAMFSGFAGAFYGSYVGSISPDSFKFDVSVIVLCMVILGGLGSMTGVIVGGLLIMGAERMFLPEAAKVVRSLAQVQTGSFDIPAFRDPSQLKQLLFGFVLVVMMLVRPEGLLPNPERRAEFHEDDEDTIDRENAELYDAERDPQLAGH